MKKGFTMIELIFVIVILGVLASVAIPRLAATRDDAEVAKAATNLTTAVSDITAYYTAKGKFESGAQSKFQNITNALKNDGTLVVKGDKTCATVKLPANAIGNGNGAATTTSDKVELTIVFTDNDPVCKQLKKLKGVLAMCGQSDKDTVTSNCKIQIGGSGGIQF